MAAGVPAEQFWRMTKGELRLTLRGLREAERQHRRRALWHAWHTAALTRARRRLPTLGRLLSGEERPPTHEEVQTAREAHAEIDERLGGA